MALIKRLVIHPFLWAVYPILMLVAYNIQSVTPWMVYRPILVSIILAGLLFGILWLALRNLQKAGLLTALLELLFFSYGHVYGILQNSGSVGPLIGKHSILVLTWFLIFVVGAVLILRTRRNLLNLTQTLNIVAVIALIFPVIQIVTAGVNETTETSGQGYKFSNRPLPAELSGLKPTAGKVSPDIYYIILDGYGRDDTLKDDFQYDNSAFLKGLQDLGFYVAYCSQSNYSSTQLSLASSLNMNYLDVLGISEKNAEDQDDINELIYTNFARRTLNQLGYRTVVVESGFSPTEWDNADIYLSMNQNSGDVNYLGGINPFESLIMRTSAGLLLYRFNTLLPLTVRSYLDEAYNERRDRILYAFKALVESPSIPGPKFVFAHILAPHEPFVFGPNGEIVGRKYPFSLNNDLETRDPVVYRQGYKDQVAYINSQVLPMIQKILASSQTPPIIIVQGDHGPLPRVSSENGRLTILNAYYLPGDRNQKLYPTITPVNTFRLVFDAYFGANMSLLDDASFFYDKAKDVFRPSPNEREDCQVAGTGN
jgi:hypothetical protein